VLADADADAPLPLTLVEADGPPVGGLALGIDVDGLTGVPAPPAVPVPATAPGEPALPLMRPLAFGTRLTSVLPGAVITEPPTEVPGELLVMEPPAPALPVAAWAAAC